MQRKIWMVVGLLGFCCLLVACDSNSGAPVQQTVDPETRPGAKSSSQPKHDYVD